jgi:hypothetical protein
MTDPPVAVVAGEKEAAEKEKDAVAFPVGEPDDR